MVLFAYEDLCSLLENSMSLVSKSNHEKCPKKGKIVGGEDLISSLPDDILIHILSLLPSKYSWDMRVLSPRWKDLWSFVPVLDFDFDQLGPLECFTCARAYDFFKFVDVFITCHKSPCVSRFSLKCGADPTGYLDFGFERWVEKFAKLLVKEIDLRLLLDSTSSICLSFKHFTSETLVVLRLGFKLRMHLPWCGDFSSLKIIELSILDPDFSEMQRFFSNCRVLEDLKLEAFLGVSEKNHIFISMPALKRLDICLMEEDVQTYDYCIRIKAPCLENFSLHDNHLTCCLMGDFPSSDEDFPSLAEVSIIGCKHYIQDQTRHHINGIDRFFKALSNVKSLSLSYHVIKALNLLGESNLPIFNHLTHLKIYIHTCYHRTWILNILKSMVNLETLDVFTEYLDDDDDDDDNGDGSDDDDGNDKGGSDDNTQILISSQEVSSCMSRLKEITFHSFEGDIYERNLLKCLVKNAFVLQKMAIACGVYISAKEMMKLEEELLSCPKKSMTCQIVVFRDNVDHYSACT